METPGFFVILYGMSIFNNKRNATGGMDLKRLRLTAGNKDKKITITCALCGADLIFVSDEERGILEIFPCPCEELEAYETEYKTEVNDWLSGVTNFL